MPSTINATSTGSGGLISTGDASGQLELQANGSTKMTVSASGVSIPTLVGANINLATNVTGTLPIANGGTGTTSTTFANLATNVTGTLPVANGGTGATTLTSNNVILGNGTSAVQFVAPGTNGNVLTSNGTTWTSAAGPSAGWNLISTLTANNSATIEFTTGINSTYDMYAITGAGLTHASGGVVFRLRTYQSSSLDTGNNYYYNYGFLDTGGFVNSGFTTSGGDSFMPVLSNSVVGTRPSSFQVYIPSPSSTSLQKYIYGYAISGGSQWRPYWSVISGGNVNTTALTGVQFYYATGNIVTGVFSLYGLRKT